jgi:propanol-preferring alcohol dehydrogenase
MAMRAMVVREFGRPLVGEDRPSLIPGPGEILVQVAACGVCATDLKVVHGRLPGVPLPVVPGHEIAGRVAAAGPGVSGVQAGDRVALAHRITCGECVWCREGRENLCAAGGGRLGIERDGGFATHVVAPARNACPLPEGVSWEAGAIIPGAMAGPYRAMRHLARVRAGEWVAVIGAGGLGLHLIQFVRALGGRAIAIDVEDGRLALAARLGAEVTVNGAREAPGPAVRAAAPAGAAVVAQVVGGKAVGPAMEEAMRLVAPGGRIVLLGYDRGQAFSVDSAWCVNREVAILGALSYTRRDLADVAGLVAAGTVRPIVAATRPLAEANAALTDVERGAAPGRVVLIPED